MKKLILLLPFILVACGKAEEPRRATNCFQVEILDVSDGDTLMEINGEHPRNRILRSGKFGRAGDTFRYCE